MSAAIGWGIPAAMIWKGSGLIKTAGWIVIGANIGIMMLVMMSQRNQERQEI